MNSMYRRRVQQHRCNRKNFLKSFESFYIARDLLLQKMLRKFPTIITESNTLYETCDHIQPSNFVLIFGLTLPMAFEKFKFVSYENENSFFKLNYNMIADFSFDVINFIPSTKTGISMNWIRPLVSFRSKKMQSLNWKHEQKKWEV